MAFAVTMAYNYSKKDCSFRTNYRRKITNESIGWSKTTTYTVIKKCIDKGAAERIEPGFVCHALVSKEEAQQYETQELINKMYDGSADQLVASILGNKKLNSQEIERLKKLVSDLK